MSRPAVSAHRVVAVLEAMSHILMHRRRPRPLPVSLFLVAVIGATILYNISSMPPTEHSARDDRGPSLPASTRSLTPGNDADAVPTHVPIAVKSARPRREKRIDVAAAAGVDASASPLPHPTALATRCDADAGVVPAPVGLSPLDNGSGWVPDLAAAAAATSFPELRFHLSGRSNVAAAVLPADLPLLLQQYRDVHADILAGRRPLRVWIIECHGESHEDDCGGLGDRVKALRMFFYLCVASGRALLMSDDWEGVPASEIFLAHGIPDFYVTDAMRRQLRDMVAKAPAAPPPVTPLFAAPGLPPQPGAFPRLHFRRSEMVGHTDAMLAAAFTAAAFSNDSVLTVHTSKVPLMVLANETLRYSCDGGRADDAVVASLPLSSDAENSGRGTLRSLLSSFDLESVVVPRSGGVCASATHLPWHSLVTRKGGKGGEGAVNVVARRWEGAGGDSGSCAACDTSVEKAFHGVGCGWCPVRVTWLCSIRSQGGPPSVLGQPIVRT